MKNLIRSQIEPIDIPIGLPNYGNTCFANVVLQCLANSDALLEQVEREYHRVYRNEGESVVTSCELARKQICLLCMLEKAFITIRYPHNQQAVARLVKAIIDSFPLFPMKVLSKGRQEDCHEFLMNVLFAFQLNADRIKSDKENSLNFVQHADTEQLFQGKMVQTIECNNCHFISLTEEPIIDISLNIKTSSTLEASIEDYFKVVHFRGDNCYHCSQCQGKTEAKQSLSMVSYPQILCLHLKRFYFDGMDVKKIKHYVNFPSELPISAFPLHRSQKDQMTLANQIYELKSVIVHKGETMSTGHYICYVKRSTNAWYIADDTRIQAVREEEVLESCAYVLFYELRLQSPSTPMKSIITPKTPSTTSKIIRTVSSKFNFFEKLNLWKAKIQGKEKLSSLQPLQQRNPSLRSIEVIESQPTLTASIETQSHVKSPIDLTEEGDSEQRKDPTDLSCDCIDLSLETGGGTLKWLESGYNFDFDSVVRESLLLRERQSLLAEELMLETESHREDSLPDTSREDSLPMDDIEIDWNVTTSSLLLQNVTHRRVSKRKRDTFNDELDKRLHDFEDRKHYAFIHSPVTSAPHEGEPSFSPNKIEDSPTKKQRTEEDTTVNSSVESSSKDTKHSSSTSFSIFHQPFRLLRTMGKIMFGKKSHQESTEPTLPATSVDTMAQTASSPPTKWIPENGQIMKGLETILFEPSPNSNGAEDSKVTDNSLVWI